MRRRQIFAAQSALSQQGQQLVEEIRQEINSRIAAAETEPLQISPIELSAKTLQTCPKCGGTFRNLGVHGRFCNGLS